MYLNNEFEINHSSLLPLRYTLGYKKEQVKLYFKQL